MLKGYLQTHDIEFEDKKADQDQSIAKELYELSGQLGVPFTVIEKDDGTKEKVLGFDRAKINSVLGL
jgi:hypothetical protein